MHLHWVLTLLPNMPITVWIPSNKIYTSRHVTFHENHYPYNSLITPETINIPQSPNVQQPPHVTLPIQPPTLDEPNIDTGAIT